MAAADVPCAHLDSIRDLVPSADGCEDCLPHRRRMGAPADVHELRARRCCDNSPNRHATAHYRETGDPIIRSAEPGEAWGYCYPDDLYMERLPVPG